MATQPGKDLPASETRRLADDGGAPARWRDVLSVGLLGCLFAAALLLIADTIYVASVHEDAAVRANEERIVNANLAMLQNAIAGNVADYTQWDDAVENLAVTFDPIWAKRNIGPTVADTLRYDVTLLLDPGNRAIYGQVGGTEEADEAAELLGPSALRLAEMARPDARPGMKPVAAIVGGPDGLFAAAAGAIVPEAGSALVAPPGPPSVLLFAKRIDDTVLRAFEINFGLAGLTLDRTAGPTGLQATSDLHGPDGGVVGRIAWTPRQPGQRWITRALPALAGTLLAVAIFAILAVRRLRLAGALQTSEARLTDFAEASSDWLWETDAEQRFAWFSAGFARITGMDPSALLGRSRSDVGMTRGTSAAWQAHLADLEALRPFRDFTYTLSDLSSRERILRISGKPIFTADGTFLCYRGTGRDVTDEWEAARRIRESENRFRSLVENLRGIVFVHGTAGDGPHGYDEDGAQVFGADAAKLAGTVDERQTARIDSWYDAVIDADRPDYLAAEQRRKETGEPYTIEYRIRHPGTGNERWVREVAWIVDAPEEKRRYLDSYIIDITDEKQAALALSESDVRLQLALTASGMGTWDVDLRSGIERWNDAHFSLFGVEPATFTPSSETFMALVDPRDRERIQRIGEDVVAGVTGPDFTNDYRIIRPDGTTRWIGGGGRLLRDAEGRPELLIGVSFDITERKQRELALEAAHTRLAEQAQLLEARNSELEAANQAKSRFVANVSHEIRTPMNSVLGFADLLAGTTLTEAQYRYVEVIQDTGRQLMTILNDILDIAKLEAGRLDLEKIDFALAVLLEQIRSLLSPQASERGLQLVIEQITQPSLIVRGDPTRLRQILVNLVGNGLKFTSQGMVGVTVRQMLAPDDGVRLRFEVRDTGIGIPVERQAELFRAFVQADSSTTRHYGGSGLGLVICKSLVVAMGGAIGLQSEAGKGSVFWFELPFEFGDAVVAAERSVFAPAKIRALRVLLADDVAPNRELLEKMLERYGHEVLCAEDGAEALEIASRERLDVILMDVQMPVMDGMEATRRIRQLAAPWNAVPIFALSANVMTPERERYLAAGMDLYLTKPVVWTELFAALARVATGGNARGEVAAAEPVQQMRGLDGVPLLDLPLLQGLAANVPEHTLASLLTRGIDGASDSCRRLRAALADPVILAQEAHRLRGTAGSFGFALVSSLAGAIEDRLERCEDVADLVGDLDKAVAATRDAAAHLSWKK